MHSIAKAGIIGVIFGIVKGGSSSKQILLAPCSEHDVVCSDSIKRQRRHMVAAQGQTPDDDHTAAA